MRLRRSPVTMSCSAYTFIISDARPNLPRTKALAYEEAGRGRPARPRRYPRGGARTPPPLGRVVTRALSFPVFLLDFVRPKQVRPQTGSR